MAVPELPFEILWQIAQYLKHREENEPRVKLGSYALVNKTWQTVFEANIYSSILLCSSSGAPGITVGNAAPQPKRGMTFQRLDEITTGPQDWRHARRVAIKHLEYLVSVPHWLCDGMFKKIEAERDSSEPHTYDERFRQENDKAFTHRTCALFEYLASPSWTDRASPLTLTITLQAENFDTSDMPTEPATSSSDRHSIADYRANFTPGTVLRRVHCVRAVNCVRDTSPANIAMDNGISIPAHMIMLGACDNREALVDVTLDGSYYIPYEDAVSYESNRSDVAKSLQLLPKSVRKLSLIGCDDYSIEEWVPVTEQIESVDISSDVLSRALHSVSLQLRALCIDSLSYTPEFFSLSDQDGSSSILWPHLETLELCSHMMLPDGQWLDYRYQPGAPNGTDILLTPWAQLGSQRLRCRSNETKFLSIVPEYFDHLYTSAGRAAHKMPRLKLLCLLHGMPTAQELFLIARDGKHFLSFSSDYGYSPGPDVLSAWNITERQVLLRDGDLEAEYDFWPPA